MTAADRPISIAILALGGQGGGVLSDWIVATAEANGWQAQSTSVPGVAQRTGATLYYIETMPAPPGKAPVLALMPTPGDVDIVIASELMEAGRAILRGLVTPDRTTLITSTQRAYAIAEKERPGEGIGDPQAVAAAAQLAGGPQRGGAHCAGHPHGYFCLDADPATHRGGRRARPELQEPGWRPLFGA